MFHKAIELKYLEGTTMEVTFQDGIVKQYDISVLFDKYPQLKALTDRELFLSGKLMGTYGIMWTDDLDIEVETIYEDGATVGKKDLPANLQLASAIASARAKAGLSQTQVAALTGIDQSDLSKIERGVANPSFSTLERIASALGGKLTVSIELSSAY